MFKHVTLIGTAVGLGLVSGFAAQIALRIFAVFSLLAGPGLQESLNRAAERPDVFWIFGGATAIGLTAIFYLVWGVIRLVGRARGKGR